MTPSSGESQFVAPPAGVIRLEKQSLGLIPLRGIRVARERQVVLGLFERFLLEAAGTLGEFATSDIEAVTGLPASAIDRGLWRLRSSGAIESKVPSAGDGSAWKACPTTIATMLERNERTERYPDEVSLLGLLCSNELLACSARSSDMRNLEGFTAPGKMPSAAEVPGVGRETWIRNCHDASRIHDLPAGVVDFPGRGSDGMLGKTCARFEATVDFGIPAMDRTGGDDDELPPVSVTLHDAEDGERVVRFSFPSEMEIVRSWGEKLAFLEDARTITRILNELDSQKSGGTGASWYPGRGLEIPLDSREAKVLFEAETPLEEPFGIRLQIETGMAVVRARYIASDSVSEDYFAIDRLISRLTDHVAAGAELTVLTSCFHEDWSGSGDCDLSLIRGRAWRLGRHPLIYRLREVEDFHYDEH